MKATHWFYSQPGFHHVTDEERRDTTPEPTRTPATLTETITWIPIAERLPPMYEEVLVADIGMRRVELGWFSDGRWHSLSSNVNVTHWAEQPKGPQ